MGVSAWIVLGPLVPVALAFVLLSTWPGRTVAAVAVVAAEATVLGQAAGDDDRTALAFALAFVPLHATAGVLVLGVVERVVLARVGVRRGAPVTVGDRLAALAVDGVLVLAGAWRLAESWDGPGQVAVPIAAAVGYLTVGAATGGTLGHRALRLRVVDAVTGGRLPVGRALVRSALVVAEVAGSAFLVPLAVAWADVAGTLGDDGRSFGDRLVGSQVIRAGRHTEPD